jgi:hypothetical protein
MPMIRTVLLATAAFALAASPSARAAASCKDMAGETVKCHAKPGAKKMAARAATKTLIAKKKVKPRVTDTTGRVSYKW